MQHSFLRHFTTRAVLLAITFATADALAGPAPSSSSGKQQTAVERATEPKWYISLGGGTDFDYGTTDFSNKVFANLGGPALDIRAHPFDSVYDTNFFRIQAEVGYVLCPNVELFGNFRYSAADSEPTAGSFLVLPNGARAEIFDKWGNYRSYGGEAGIRYFFVGNQARIRPYISISGGATFVDSIDLRASLGDGTVLFKGGFYDSSVVGTAACLLGVEIPISRHFSVGADAGVRYESTLTENDRDVTAAGFAPVKPINDNAGNRLYCPLTVYAKVRF